MTQRTATEGQALDASLTPSDGAGRTPQTPIEELRDANEKRGPTRQAEEVPKKAREIYAKTLDSAHDQYESEEQA